MTITVRLGTPDLALVTYFNVSVWQDWMNSPDNDQRLIFAHEAIAFWADMLVEPWVLTRSKRVQVDKSKRAHRTNNVLCQGPRTTSLPFPIEPDCDKGKGPPLCVLAWRRSS